MRSLRAQLRLGTWGESDCRSCRRSPGKETVGISSLQLGLARRAVCTASLATARWWKTLVKSPRCCLCRRIRTSWSKTHLDWLNTECRGKSMARLGAGWDLGQETLDILDRDSKGGSSPLDIRLLELNSPLMAKEHRTSSTLQPIAGYSMRERVNWRDDVPARISLAPICNLNRPSCVAVS